MTTNSEEIKIKKPHIYFTGAHSTGKTTLTNWVSEQYNLPVIPEVARTCMNALNADLSTIRSDMQLCNKFQEDIFHRQIKEEKNFRRRIQGFVSDRAFDNLAYAAEHCEILHKLTETNIYQCYVKHHLKEDNALIFFVRPSKETIAHDGIRNGLSWEAINRIDGMIKFMLKFHDINYVEVVKPDVQYRQHLIKVTMKQKFDI